jgi:hypothetical protein
LPVSMKLMNPWHFSLELIMVIIVFFLCFLIFLRTKEIYNLTKHKGIFFFRYAFFYLGFAYLFRFIMISSFFLIDIKRFIHPRELMIYGGFITGIFSILGMIYLIASLIYKNYEYKYINLGIFSLTFIIAFSIIIIKGPLVIFITHICLFLFALGIMLFEKKKSFSPRAIYILLLIFWIINYLPMIIGRLLPLEFRMLIAVISIGLFVAVYIKAIRWLK